MKITNIKPLIARGAVRNLMIVKIESDNGYHGWGESGLVGRELAVKGAVEHFREFLIGKDPRRIGALWQEMYRGQYF
jgi:galactonate dehydratase